MQDEEEEKVSELDQRVARNRELGEAICEALEREIQKLGLPEKPRTPRWESAQFKLRQDPALGMESLEVLWLGGRGEKLGSATLHGDGTFFAEFDVIQPHPHRHKWFVEAVCAWGAPGIIKAEARLLPMPD
jgi:hypothetical protein